MVNIVELTKDLSLVTLLEAVDLDMLLTGMNQAPVDMPSLMEKYRRLKAQVTLVDIGTDASQVAEVLQRILNLSLDAIKQSPDNASPLATFQDIDQARVLRDQLNAVGAHAIVVYIYSES